MTTHIQQAKRKIKALEEFCCSETINNTEVFSRNIVQLNPMSDSSELININDNIDIINEEGESLEGHMGGKSSNISILEELETSMKESTSITKEKVLEMETFLNEINEAWEINETIIEKEMLRIKIQNSEMQYNTFC